MAKLTIDQLKLLIQEAVQPRFFHGSSRPQKVGSVLSGGNFAANSTFPRQFEQLVDARRPKGMAGRLNGIFMVTNPNNVSWAGGSDSYVYEVAPIGRVFRHHQDYLAVAANLFNQHTSSTRGSWRSLKISKQQLSEIQDELNESIDAYWSGVPFRGGSSTFEWIAPKAKILSWNKRASIEQE